MWTVKFLMNGQWNEIKEPFRSYESALYFSCFAPVDCKIEFKGEDEE